MKTTLDERQENRGSQAFPVTRGAAGSDQRENRDGWPRAWATMGAAVWATIAVLARMRIAPIGEIELLFMFAPLVIIPLGMELGRQLERTTGAAGFFLEAARRAQPAGAALAVWALWLAPGRTAALLAAGWMVVCLLMAAGGIVNLLRPSLFRSRPSDACARIALNIARMDLAVGGAWLVASRLGMRPMGIQEPIGLLTAVHFHFAGFATATIAAAMLKFRAPQGSNRWFGRLVLGIAVLPYLVAAGFVISPALKMTAAVLFSAGVAALAVFLRSCSSQIKDVTARVLLQIASGAVFAGMIFSAAYAVADFTGSDILPIPLMARTHGVLNSVGFCLCGLLGWLVENRGQGPEVRGQ
jgi:hypothetical protein